MRARRPYRPSFTLISSTLAVFSLVALVAGGSARASAADPFAPQSAPPTTPSAPQSNVAAPSQQAPASAPAGSEANFPTGLVERLPSSAYPEPVIRGLYGSSLWLDMQGLQWPYYPRIGVGISGYGWVDTDYKRTRIGDTTQSDHTTKLFQQGRFALRVTPTYTNGSWFVQAQAELIANKNQLEVQPNVVDADDLWVRTGVWQSWDITVGRFEAFPVFHLGMGLDLNTDERDGAYDSRGPIVVPKIYGATFMFYRPAGPGNIAFHYYPGGPRFLRPLRIELLAQWGNDNTVNTIGGRPALIYDLGWVKFRFAAEYQRTFAVDPSPMTHNEQHNSGLAGSVQFVLAPWVEFGPNFGKAATDLFTAMTFPNNDTGRSGDILSYGGFLNARPFTDMLVGVGGNYATFTNLHQNAAGQFDKSTSTQAFVALQYLVHHQLFVKVVGAYAKSHFDFSYSNTAPFDDDMYSVRVRLMYLY